MLINNVKNIYRTAKLNSTVLSDSLLHNSRSTSSESFVNNSGLSSKTSYLIWVDTKNFKVNTDEYMKMIPLKRMGEAVDIAKAVKTA